MKKIIAFLLAATMLLSLAACGGDKDNTPSASSGNPASSDTGTPAPTPDTTPSDTTNPEADDNEDDAETPAVGGNSIVMWYGANYYGIHETTFYCPEGAYIDESDLEDYKEDGSVSSFNVYDDVREYTATGESYWSRELYNNEDIFYEVLPQLYFYGELDEKNAEEYPTSSYDVTDLGFQWEGKDMMLIEVSYTSAGGFEYNDVFVGVECEELYWRAKEDGGIEENLSAPMLVGFGIYSPGVELTVDQYAWIAGQLFGVDSGRTWALEDEGEESIPEPAADVDVSELYGTWIDPESDWGDTFVFNPDGTGVLVSGPQYPYTYSVIGSTLTITYDDGDEESFEVSVIDGKPVLVDQFGYEIKLEPSDEEVEIIVEEEVDFSADLIGVWTDEAGTETYAFYADGTGYQIYEGTEYGYTYEIDEDYVRISYDDGDSDSFYIDIDGDTLTIAYNWVYFRQ